ncbi:DUF2231 domain-containing protein [Fundidesulfovibrio soli]|uniref:DUF2231 domain-containing protein n=1 Tax=Fundidesulfovibrio soli TaxID=2922716 RepID=UPI001FAFE39D|nr:DUF2231 domain-containing protein [Fundidesulfovibrio soli]
MSADENVISQETLAKCNGEGGNPIYVAHEGRVYDVSASRLWKGGKHMNRHLAGGDLSLEFASAPHNVDVLKRFPQVGIIAATPNRKAEPELPQLLRRIPLLRRHPHPMAVHFPIVFSIAATGFVLLYLAFGWKGFELTSFNCLGAGAIFTPVAMLTGYFTWKYNYMRQWILPVVVKLSLSPLLFLDLATCFIWRLADPRILDTPGTGRWLYLSLVLGLTLLVSVIGWFGATLSLPLHRKPAGSPPESQAQKEHP